GDATGPHLHLQLQPASAWPQNEAWFQAAAGTAFAWQDGAEDNPDFAATPVEAPQFRSLASVSTPVAAPEPAAPVFQVVPTPCRGHETARHRLAARHAHAFPEREIPADG